MLLTSIAAFALASTSRASQFRLEIPNPTSDVEIRDDAGHLVPTIPGQPVSMSPNWSLHPVAAGKAVHLISYDGTIPIAKMVITFKTANTYAKFMGDVDISGTTYTEIETRDGVVTDVSDFTKVPPSGRRSRQLLRSGTVRTGAYGTHYVVTVSGGFETIWIDASTDMIMAELSTGSTGTTTFTGPSRSYKINLANPDADHDGKVDRVHGAKANHPNVPCSKADTPKNTDG